MKEIPVAQILHPLSDVHHELQQCLQGDVLTGVNKKRHYGLDRKVGKSLSPRWETVMYLFLFYVYKHFA